MYTRGLGLGFGPSKRCLLGTGLIGDGRGSFGPKLMYQIGLWGLAEIWG
jgi:hypothetical protein